MLAEEREVEKVAGARLLTVKLTFLLTLAAVDAAAVVDDVLSNNKISPIILIFHNFQFLKLPQ